MTHTVVCYDLKYRKVYGILELLSRDKAPSDVKDILRVEAAHSWHVLYCSMYSIIIRLQM